MSKKSDVGKIVLQEFVHGSCCIGLVVGNHMLFKLSKDDQKCFKSNTEKAQILLVIGWFPEYENYDFMFGDKPKRFPFYVLGWKDNSRYSDFKHELALFKSHQIEQSSRASSLYHLQSNIFAFDKKRSEILAIIAIMQYWLKTKSDDVYKPDWLRYIIPRYNRKMIFDELKKAIG